MSPRSPQSHVLALGATLAVSLGAVAAAQAAPSSSVLARHLATPKYLAVGPGGDLYVAEAGRGGRQCVRGTGTRGTSTQFCIGDSGRVITIAPSGTQRTVIAGLASSREVDTDDVSGVTAISFRAGRPVLLMRNSMSDAIGESSLPGPPALEFGNLSAPVQRTIRVLTVVRRGHGFQRRVLTERSEVLEPLARISRFVAIHPQSSASLGGTPGETPYDSDPHDVVAYRGGFAVVDAGANDVLVVSRTGRVSIAARLPTETEQVPAGAMGPGSPAETVQAQSVPSSVTVGPDGALYVGVLRGIPGLPGSAQVYRVVPGQPAVAVVTGLTRVSSLAFLPDGHLLILESNVGGALAPPSTPGALLTATLDGSEAVGATNTGLAGLSDPTGLAVNSAGTAYITNDSASLDAGEVLRVTGLD